MTIQSFLILVVIFVLLGLGVMFISQNGGWHGGCTGNCASCHQHCEDESKKKSSAQK